MRFNARLNMKKKYNIKILKPRRFIPMKPRSEKEKKPFDMKLFSKAFLGCFHIKKALKYSNNSYKEYLMLRKHNIAFENSIQLLLFKRMIYNKRHWVRRVALKLGIKF